MALSNNDLFVVQDPTDSKFYKLTLAELIAATHNEGPSTPTLQSVTDAGAITTNLIETAGITSNGVVTVADAVAGVEATINNATFKSKINTGNTQPFFVGQKGTASLFEVEYDGTVNIGAGSFGSSYAATIDGNSGQIFAGQVNGKNVTSSTDDVVSVFAGLAKDGTQTFTAYANGNVNATGQITGDSLNTNTLFVTNIDQTGNLDVDGTASFGSNVTVDGRINSGSSTLENRAFCGYSADLTGATISAIQYNENGPVWQGYSDSVSSTLATSTIMANGNITTSGSITASGAIEGLSIDGGTY